MAPEYWQSKRHRATGLHRDHSIIGVIQAIGLELLDSLHASAKHLLQLQEVKSISVTAIEL